MLQLLVFPFSLPSSQMIFFLKKKSQFLKIIFSMLKKYGKAIKQPSGTLPLHLHSEQMDGQSTEPKTRHMRSLSLALPSAGFPSKCLPSTHRTFLSMDSPLGPIPSMECGRLGMAKPLGVPRQQEGHGWGGDREDLCSGRLATKWECGAPGEAEIPLTLCRMRPQLPGAPPLSLSLYQSWPPVLRKATIQEKEAESTGCVIQ